MDLIVEKPTIAYNLSQIQPGYLLYAKHNTWDFGKAGFVTSITEKQVTVQYHPGIGNVTNHFHIPVSEAAANEWEIRWSADMANVFQYNIGEGQEMEKESEARGTDI